MDDGPEKARFFFFRPGRHGDGVCVRRCERLIGVCKVQAVAVVTMNMSEEEEERRKEKRI